MASKVDLCNFALSRLGASTITSLADATTEANLCNLMFDILAQEVMMEGAWSSTIIRTDLALTTTTPSFGFTSEFQLPVDPKSLKVLQVNESAPGATEFVIESDKLLTNLDAIKIKYVGFLTDTEEWDTMLTRAFISRLASELAYPITGSDTKTLSEFERYQLFLKQGLALDGQQGSSLMTNSSGLIEVR